MASATRREPRVEDLPLRVEVIDEEEVAEKVAMMRGDIAMMLNETSDIRVQTTSPSLGGANVRIQGLVGRYSLLLASMKGRLAASGYCRSRRWISIGSRQFRRVPSSRRPTRGA